MPVRPRTDKSHITLLLEELKTTKTAWEYYNEGK